MFTAAPLPAKYPNPNGNVSLPYKGDSFQATFSPPQPAPGVVSSNLQTLRKFSNLESLQNLNVSNDSPRASYSSSSSSTASSSSNLIIPEIFKQDGQNHSPNAPYLPPKSREIQNVSSHQNFSPNFHSPQHPQYPPSTYQNHSMAHPNKSFNSISNNCNNSTAPIPSSSSCFVAGPPSGGKLKPLPDSFINGGANQRLQNEVHNLPPTSPLASSHSNTHSYPPSSYSYSPLKSQQPLPTSRFTSYPETSSFTCYSSSSTVPPQQCSMTTVQASYVPQQLSGPLPPNGSNEGPDFRRLSDPNTRKGLPDTLPSFQMIPNEYPQHVFSNQYIPTR